MIPQRSGERVNARNLNSLAADMSHTRHNRGAGVPLANQLGGRSSVPYDAQTLLREGAVAVQVINTGATALATYQPFDIFGHYYAGGDEKARRLVTVGKPSSGDPSGYFGVAAEPIAVGEVGLGYLTGVCLCLIKTNLGDLFADLLHVGDTFLTGNPTTGSAQILWEDGGHSTTAHRALIRFPFGGGGSFAPSYARIACDVPITLANIQTIDGALLFDGDHVLVTAQTSPFDNGLYICKAGASWIRTGTLTPAMVVAIFEGNDYANTLWLLAEQSAIVIGSTGLPFRCMRRPEVRTARVATTAPITLSGTQTIDGIAVAVGDWVLVRAQGGFGGSGDGFMRCASGAWYYDTFTQPSIVNVREGTANGRLTFFNTPSGWLANYGVYA